MANNLFNRITGRFVIALIAIEILSLVAFTTGIMNAIFLLLLVLAGLASLKDIRYGLYIALAELFIGSQGQLFFYNWNGSHIGIRLGLFVVINLAWLIHLLRRRKSSAGQLLKPNSLWLLAGIIIWGTISALLHHNAPNSIFFDVNAWLYFGYIFLFVDTLRVSKLQEFGALITAATLVISFKTLIIFNLFSHNYQFLDTLYRWIRDTRIGEITLLSGNIYRVFFQSHIILTVGLFWFLIQALRTDNIRQRLLTVAAMIPIATAIIISLSRSNWLGLALAGIIFLLYYGLTQKSWRAFGSALLISVVTMLFGALLAYTILNLPPQNASPENMLQERLSSGEAAASSRSNQLLPLLEKFKLAPLLGSGFGTTVTYTSNDPRIVSATGGIYTTYTFELGYLDLLVKLGLVGTFIYLGYLIKLTVVSLREPDLQPLAFALIAIMITHSMSPYLNHPLGIGLILILSSLTIFNKKLI